MTIEEAIELAKEFQSWHRDYGTYEEDPRKFCEFQEALEEVINHAEASSWQTSKHVPTGQDLLISDRQGNVRIAEKSGKDPYWWIDSEIYVHESDVDAWMELPPSYERPKNERGE